MEKELKICIAIRNKDFEDSVIEAIKSKHWKHSFVNIDDIASENKKDTLFFIVEDSYLSILDLIEMHNSCELNFLPVIVLSSDESKYLSWIGSVKYPEKYFLIKMQYINELMVQIIKVMDSFRDTYQFKKIYQFGDRVANAFKMNSGFSDFMNEMLPDLLKLLYTERGSVMLLNDRGNLVIESSTKKELVGMEVTYKPNSVAWTVIDTQKPVFVENIDNDIRFQKGEGYSKDYFLSIPIFLDNKIAGVLNLTDKITSLLFDSADYNNANNLIKMIEPYIYIHTIKRTLSAKV